MAMSSACFSALPAKERRHQFRARAVALRQHDIKPDRRSPQSVNGRDKLGKARAGPGPLPESLQARIIDIDDTDRGRGIIEARREAAGSCQRTKFDRSSARRGRSTAMTISPASKRMDDRPIGRRPSFCPAFFAPRSVPRCGGLWQGRESSVNGGVGTQPSAAVAIIARLGHRHLGADGGAWCGAAHRDDCRRTQSRYRS